MTRPLKRVLLTNDDGVNAPGLAELEAMAGELADEVWVVAPEQDQSGSSHSVTLHEPLRVRELGPRRFAVNGTPSDCVIMALGHLMVDQPPALLLSGINRGANMADAVAYSGTLGAAMTSLVMGLPAIALSQAFRTGEAVRWETARRHGPAVITALLDMPEQEHVCFSVNFPAVPPQAVSGFRVATQGRGSITGVDIDRRVDTRGLPYFWLSFRHDTQRVQTPGTDVDCLRECAVAVSPLRLERDDSTLGNVLLDRLHALNPNVS